MEKENTYQENLNFNLLNEATGKIFQKYYICINYEKNEVYKYAPKYDEFVYFLKNINVAIFRSKTINTNKLILIDFNKNFCKFNFVELDFKFHSDGLTIQEMLIDAYIRYLNDEENNAPVKNVDDILYLIKFIEF